MTAPAIRAGVKVSVRAAVAGGLSIAIAHALELQYPFYAMIAAVIVTDLSPAQTRRLGLPRLAGTVIGTLAGGLLSLLLPAGAVAVTIGIMLAMCLSHLTRQPDAAKLAGYLAAIVLLEYRAEPWTYAVYRFIETGLGIAMAVLVSLIPPLMRDD